MSKNDPRIADHLANERTFLAWIRTGIAIMAFGFVVVKFALFITQINILLGTQPQSATTSSTPSAWIGVFLVGIGSASILLAFFRFRYIGKRIEKNTFFPSFRTALAMAVLIFVIGVTLMFFLLPNVQ
jgi:putative membrane protein